MSDRLLLAESLPVSAAVSSPPSSRGLVLPLLLTCAAFLLLYGRSLIGPVIFHDDFQILVQSWTWQRTWDGLWVPQNEHAMPLGRLFCFGLEWLAGRLPVLPFLTCWVGPGMLLLGLALLYVFVRRELGHPFYAALVLVLFAVTTVYHQAVWWFAASFAIFSLDTLLLGLLAAQRWQQTGRGIYLVLTVLACLLAPGWFALGVLAGPLCCLYLMPISFRREEASAVYVSRDTINVAAKQLGLALLPLAGTGLFLAISLPRTAQAILHTYHYGDQTAVEAFDPWVGLAYTARSLVDNLLLGLAGVGSVEFSVWAVVPILLAVVALGAWWWWQARDHRLMLLGLGMIGSAYMLCYSARALWEYHRMVEPAFSRYHLLPHLGLVLFFCGGLPARQGRWFTLDATGVLTTGQRRLLYLLIAVCFVVQLPRGITCASPTGWEQSEEVGEQQTAPHGTAWWADRARKQFEEIREQRAALLRIDEVEARCRRYHISADAAREALDRLDVPLSLDVINGWDFLIGSDDPHPLPREEVRRLLDELPPAPPETPKNESGGASP